MFQGKDGVSLQMKLKPIHVEWKTYELKEQVKDNTKITLYSLQETCFICEKGKKM